MRGSGTAPLSTRVVAALLLTALLAGCGSGSRVVGPQAVPLDFGDEQIHAPAGDMTATVPRGWVMLDPTRLVGAQAFGAYCNQEYTLAVAFARAAAGNDLSTPAAITEAIDAGFALRQKRSGNRAVLLERGETAVRGRRVPIYLYTTDSSRTITRVGVIATRQNLYECAITPLGVGLVADTVSPDSMARLHQSVLEGVEW